MPEETEELEQQGMQEEIAPIITIGTSIGTLSAMINPDKKNVGSNLAFAKGNNNTTLDIQMDFSKNSFEISSASANTSQNFRWGDGGNLTLAADLTHTDNGNSAGIKTGYTLHKGDLSIEGNGSVSTGVEDCIQHNVDISAYDIIAGVNSNVTLHSDRQDHSITLGAKKTLLNPDNINGHADDYQERKEDLQESGDRWSVTSKIGYSQEKSVYTENSVMYRANNKNYITANYNQNNGLYETKVTGDLQNIRLDYTYNQTENEDNKSKTHSLDTMVKDGKNQYTCTLETGKTTTPDGTSIKHSDINTGIMINRTEYGEFQDGFNAKIEGGLHTTDGNLDGYSGTLDVAYNKYGGGEQSKDFLIRGQLGFTHNTSLHEVKASIDFAQRFNGCRTILEESAGWRYTNDHQKPSLGIFSVNTGVYQQVGKNFGDASIYTQLEYQHYASSKHTNALRIYSGAKVKATDKLSFNLENCYGTDCKWSGNIGLIYNF